jgi:HEAT repeat protein
MSHIFISYKRQQIQLALRVRDQLRAWGYDTWLDQDRLLPGMQWANEIDRAIKASHACLGIMTPAALESRYVTNEWDIAIMKGNWVPLMFERTEPHYKYIDLQYVDFASTPTELAFNLLKKRLENIEDQLRSMAADPYADYLQVLYDRINRYLDAKLLKSLRDADNQPEPIALTTEPLDGAVDFRFEKQDEIDPLFLIGGIADEPPQQFRYFVDAFDHYNRRILLLGEPGSGKTITLLQFARDAIIKRRNNPSAPLPILGIIPGWNADEQPSIAHWLAKSHGAPPNAEQIIHEGKALLLLDGLDELGSERPVNPYQPDGEKYDPRQRFMSHLPENNQMLVTCRRRDYEQIGTLIELHKAITLKPLDNDQLRQYLKAQPELLAFVQSESRLQEWLDTPLLLSYFALVYETSTDDERMSLQNFDNAAHLREKVFSEYIRQRYEHEQRKPYHKLPFSLDTLYAMLGQVSMKNIADWKLTANVFTISDFDLSAGTDALQWLADLVRMNLFSPIGGERYQFVHIYLRDYFAYQFAIANLQHKNWGIAVQCVMTLGNLGDERAIDPLIQAFPLVNVYVKATIARVLGKLRAEKAIPTLVAGFKTNDDSLKQAIADALVKIGQASISYILPGFTPNSGFIAQSAAILGRLNALDVLINGLKNESICSAATYGLSHSSHPDAIRILVSLIEHEHVEVRHNAIVGIQHLRVVDAVPSLIASLKDIRRTKHYHRQIATYQLASSRWIDQRRICDIAAEALEAIGTREALEAVADWRKSQKDENQ